MTTESWHVVGRPGFGQLAIDHVEEDLPPFGEFLSYDQTTGFLFWKRQVRGAKIGSRAGSSEHQDGYRVIRFRNRRFSEHRVAWFIQTGRWPENSIDHVNGVKSDNRWANLRSATHAQNMANRPLPRNNTSGFRGVSWNKSCKKWQAKIRHNGKWTYLGVFLSRTDASSAYERASIEMHGEFRFRGSFTPTPSQVRELKREREDA